MSRILVCGLCPLPFENTRQNYGPGIRSWQLARSLAAGGHHVHLVAMAMQATYEAGAMVAREERQDVGIRRLAIGEFLDPRSIQSIAADFRPDALVGATAYGSFAAAQSRIKLPFWADQFGHFMAEAQAIAAIEGKNWPLAEFWRMVSLIATRLDKISVVSEPQKYAAIGELGATGRLNLQTCGYSFVEVIPCPISGSVKPKPGRLVRGVKAPEDSFLVLWSGGFNVWSDVDTLFEGVELAMRQSPEIHFVSTGGAVAGHNTQTYRKFQDLVKASEFVDRFHLQGWVMAEDIPGYVAEADIGVVTDKPIYEGQLGSKNRIIQWMDAGLPAVFNRIGALGKIVAEEEIGLTFPVGNAVELGNRILWCRQNGTGLKQIASRAQQLVRRRFTIEATTKPLRRWAANPEFAPDRPNGEQHKGVTAYEDLPRRIKRNLKKVSWLRRSSLLRSIRDKLRR